VPDIIPPRWSVVIPAYNEAQRLPAYLSEVVAYFDGRGEPYEVIVVDDGSEDETAARVLEAQAIHQAVTLHRLAENRGKGFAVRAGMRAARGDLRLMADADGATPIAEVKRLETVIQAGADLAVGSRAPS
jgi:dolichyl-phosphate beta-glucosyltransferase